MHVTAKSSALVLVNNLAFIAPDWLVTRLTIGRNPAPADG